MEYRNLGKSGLRVSALSYGAWVTFGKQVDVAAAKQLLRTAYDAGVNFLTMRKRTKAAWPRK